MQLRQAHADPTLIRLTLIEFHQVGNDFFNSNDFCAAAKAYEFAIQKHSNFIPTDITAADWRQLIGLYLDLSDAYTELNMPAKAAEALQNATQTYGCIKDEDKTPQELQIPRDDVQKIHAHYQKKLSTQSYLTTPRYLNNISELFTQQISVNNMFTLFGSMQVNRAIALQPAHTAPASLTPDTDMSNADPCSAPTYTNN